MGTQAKYSNKLDQMEKVAKMIAQNPRISSREIKEAMGYHPKTYTQALDFLKSPAFKKLIEHHHLTAALQSSEKKAAFFGLKPVADILSMELMERVMNDKERSTIPTKQILDFMIKFARVEHDMYQEQEDKQGRPDHQKVLADMRAAVAEPYMIRKVVSEEVRDDN